ncbi:MAG: HAMP domain-containing histidine kinase [Erysipelothrix sp.]|nr:HAMP domain-containing histidine kinase [Erysipelothrix sp.]
MVVLILVNLLILGLGYGLVNYIYLEWWFLPLIFVFFNCGYVGWYLNTRNKKIDELNNYLSELNRGDYTHRVASYQEGELSILQSELYKLSVTLNHQNESLLNSQRFIQDSLNDIAHQIKTPLTSIMVMIDLMQENILPYEKQKEFTLSIQKQLNRLKNLVNQLLILSKLEAEVIEYHPTRIFDHEFFRRVFVPFEIMMDLKDIEYIGEYSHEEVDIDVDWTIEAISNIIKNAVEHLPNGGKLTIKSQVTPLFWRIELLDNGTGIDAQDVDHIFERFYRGKNSSAESVGIGLNMSERIITQQNGKISVESKENEYTRFRIEFKREGN